jgi:serine protease
MSSSSTGSGSHAQSLYPRSAVGADGNVISYFYNKQIELGGLVENTPNVGAGRTTQSIITGAMTSHGGPIQTAPKIYVVTWGNWTGSADPDGVATYYTNFIKGVGGSHWLSSVTQYTQPNGQTVGNAAGSFAGSWNDTTNKVPNLTSPFNYQSNIAAEAKRAAAHFGDYSVNASYVIMIPHGHSVYGFGTSYCAWHSSVAATGGTIAYTNLPYIPDVGATCGVGSVNSPGTNDGVSIVGGHEQAETETDPQPNTGWLDSGNNENGDKCAWVMLQNDSFTTGSFPTQPLWSNAANGCVR